MTIWSDVQTCTTYSLEHRMMTKFAKVNCRIDLKFSRLFVIILLFSFPCSSFLGVANFFFAPLLAHSHVLKHVRCLPTTVICYDVCLKPACWPDNCWKLVRCGILIVQPLDILHCHFSTSEMIFRVITLFSPSTTLCFHKQIDDVISFRLLVPVKCSNMFELIIHGCLFFHELHDLNDFCWNYFNDFNCACPLFWLHFVFSRMRACCLFFLVHSLSPPTVVKAMVYLLLGDVQKIADECGFPQHTLAKHFPSRG
jgi:hypothetical protein